MRSLNTHPTGRMARYREQLMHKYKLLPFPSSQDVVSCGSSIYVKLLLKEQTSAKAKLISVPLNSDSFISSHANERTNMHREPFTLSDALDVTGKEKKLVLIEAGPGMGKTTLAIKICKCWANGELMQQYDAVILLTLRDAEIQTAKSIKDLLLISDEEMGEEIYKEIVERSGDRVCFMLDGYDELPDQLRDSPLFIGLTDELPKCMVLCTSRPEACDRLRNLSANIIEILDLSDDQISEYLKNAFLEAESGEEKATELLSQVKNNPSIEEILLVPINVAILCYLFSLTLKLPNTLTQLFTWLCLYLIRYYDNKQTNGNAEVEHLDSFNGLPEEASEQFVKLCLIAYRGIVVDKVIFTNREIAAYGVDASSVSGLGLFLVAPSAYGKEKSYNFLHLMLQEFCAAYYISTLPTSQQMECFNRFQSKESFKMVWRFYSGITGLENKDMLYCILPSKLALICSEYRGRRMVELSHCVYEAQNDDVCRLVGDYLDGKVFLQGCRLDKMSCVAVGYLLKHCRELKSINCRKCDIDSDGFEILVNVLCHHNYSSHFRLDFFEHDIPSGGCVEFTSLLSTNVPISSLDMSVDDDDYFYVDTTLFDVLHHNTTLKELSLNGVGLKFQHIKLLGEALSHNTGLTMLDISNNSMAHGGSQHLADIRNASLREMIMINCEIGEDGANHIGEMLKHNKSIRYIDLDENYIRDDGVRKLVDHLKSNKTLEQVDLSCNGITKVGAEHLASMFTGNLCAVNDIILDGNPLEDEGVDLILQSMPTIMECIGLGDVLATTCNSSLCTAMHTVKSIRFTPPDNCDDISNSLADTTMLEQLYLHHGSDAANGMMIRGISRNNTIKTLYFEGSCLHEHTMLDLAKFIKFTETVVAFGIICEDISDNDLSVLADALAVNASVRTLIITQIEFEKSQTLQFLKQLRHNLILELAVLHGTDDDGYDDDDDEYSRDVEKLVEEINNFRQQSGVSALLQVGTSISCSSYYMKQVHVLSIMSESEACTKYSNYYVHLLLYVCMLFKPCKASLDCLHPTYHITEMLAKEN